jgi:hypothetical protein
VNRHLIVSLLAVSITILPFQPLALAQWTDQQPSANKPANLISTTGGSQAEKESFISEDAARELIQISLTPIPLSSKLRKDYDAYKVVVTSDYPNRLNLYSANINNGQAGSTAFGMVESSLTPAFLTFLLGFAGFIVIGLPIIAVKSVRNKKARKESLQFSNQIPLRELAQGETLSFTALVPFGQKPDIVLTFKDRESGLLFNKHIN